MGRLFRAAHWCAEILLYCEQRQLTAQLAATSPIYRDPSRSANWLCYFFSVAEKIPHIDFRISHLSELCIALKYFERQTLEQTSELVRRHLPVKPEMAESVEQFWSEHFGTERVLGVHFRGTDKTDEAPRVSWEAMRTTVSNYLRSNREIGALFVASDEAEFRKYMKSAFPKLPVVSLQSRLAANYKADLGAENYRKGEEAMMDCLLLSRCQALIRTTSFLSAWASIFNPKLPIVLMNRPYPQKLWFPECALIARSMNEYLPESLA